MAKAKVEVAPTISKRKMVEESLTSKGNVGPKELQAYILEKYNTEIELGMISSYKSQLLSGKGGTKSALTGSVDLKDLATVKELIERLGAPALINLIKTLK
jgi:hypothetical protein